MVLTAFAYNSVDKVTELAAELCPKPKTHAAKPEPYRRRKGQQGPETRRWFSQASGCEGLVWRTARHQQRSLGDDSCLYLPPTWTKTHCVTDKSSSGKQSVPKEKDCKTLEFGQRRKSSSSSLPAEGRTTLFFSFISHQTFSHRMIRFFWWICYQMHVVRVCVCVCFHGPLMLIPSRGGCLRCGDRAALQPDILPSILSWKTENERTNDLRVLESIIRGPPSGVVIRADFRWM